MWRKSNSQNQKKCENNQIYFECVIFGKMYIVQLFKSNLCKKNSTELKRKIETQNVTNLHNKNNNSSPFGKTPNEFYLETFSGNVVAIVELGQAAVADWFAYLLIIASIVHFKIKHHVLKAKLQWAFACILYIVRDNGRSFAAFSILQADFSLYWNLSSWLVTAQCGRVFGDCLILKQAK